MPEPIAVAFVEVLPETAGFRAATEAQLRSQLAATQFAVPPAVARPVPPSPQTGAAIEQLQVLTAAEKEAAGAATLLTEAQARYQEALVAGAGLEGRAAKAHLQKAAAAEADVAAQRALFAITTETSAATIAQIDALVTATAVLNAEAAAEERAAVATRSHAVASREASEAILAETATMTGLRGASLGVNPVFLAATAGAIAFFKSVEVASDFEEQMHQIEFATHATGDELERAAAIAEDFGRSSAIFQASSVDAITVIRELTESGKSLNEAYAATPAVLNLATAAELQHTDAVRTTVQLLDAYNLRADQATEVTDAIAIAGKSAAGSNEDFAQSLRVVSPVAQAFGLSIRDVTTLLIQMVQGGISASQAGSLLRQALLRLTNPSKAARAALKSIGINDFKKEFFDLEGNLRPDAFERLAVALQTVDRGMRRDVLATIFSRRAVQTLLTITDEQRASYEDTAEAAHELGVAQEEAAEKSRGLGGQSAELKDDLSDLGNTFGQLVIPPLTLFVGLLRDTVQGVNDLTFTTKFLADQFVDLASKIPGQGVVGGFLSDIKESAGFLVFPAAGIGRGISSIVGHFRRGDEESTAAVEDMREQITEDLQSLIGWTEAFADAADTNTQRATRSFSLAAKLAVAQATGGAQLPILREQEAKQAAALARKQRLFKAGEISEQAVINQANQLEATRADIKSILAEQAAKEEDAARDAQDKADKIVQAQQDRDDALVNAISAEQTRREARVQATTSTEALGDDIRANIALRNFFRRSIEEIAKRIREARAAHRATDALRAELQALRLAKAEVRREIERIQEENRKQREETQIESAQLDVEFAGITSTTSDERSQASINKEIRARQRLIAALKKAQDHVKKGTIEWKRLRNQIQEERQAIADLKRERGDQLADAASFRQQEFQFLQSLSGFSSNLAGNLLSTAIPTVPGGGVSTSTMRTFRPPIRPPRNAATAAEALREGRMRGATAGQMQTLIRVVMRSNELLGDLKAGVGHPEARHNKQRTRHVSETSED